MSWQQMIVEEEEGMGHENIFGGMRSSNNPSSGEKPTFEPDSLINECKLVTPELLELR